MKYYFLAIFFLLLQNCLFLNIAKSQWKKTSGPDPDKGYVDCFAMTGPYLFAGTYGHGGVYLTTNNGDSWKDVGVDNEYIHALVFQGTNLFVGTEGGIFLSSDTGGSWINSSGGLPKGIEVASMVSLGNKVFAGTYARGGFYASTDTGKSWNDSGIFYIENNHFNAMGVVDGNMFAGVATEIAFSSDSGKTWSGYTSGILPDTLSVNFHGFTFDDDNIYVATYCSGVFRLPRKGGVAWRSCSNGLFDYCMNAILAKGNTLFTSTYHGIYFSTNEGNNWTKVNDGLTDSDIVALAVNDKYLFAATDSSGVWRRSLSDFGINTPTSFSKVSLSPNPTTGIITVRNAPENIQRVTVSNILGESVIELLHPNSSDLTLDLSKLPAGMYYARFMAGGSVLTEKILKE